MDILKDTFTRERIKDIIESLGYEFVGVEFVVESGRNIMRVYIDSIGGILISDCEKVSKKIDALLNEHDEKIPQNFYLEVSSPGMERPLFEIKDYIRFKGKKVKVKLKTPLEGRKNFKAFIEDVEGDKVFFRTPEGEVFSVPVSSVFKCNIIPEELEQFGHKEKQTRDDRKRRKK